MVFFVTNRIKWGEVKVAYWPTENMLADSHFKVGHSRECMNTYLIFPPLTKSVKHTGVCWERWENDGIQKKKENKRNKKPMTTKKWKDEREKKKNRIKIWLAHNINLVSMCQCDFICTFNSTTLCLIAVDECQKIVVFLWTVVPQNISPQGLQILSTQLYR